MRVLHTILINILRINKELLSMIMKETNTILSAIITASEKLEGSKLEDSILKEIEGELTRIADYIKADEMSAIFFTIIFVLQNQRQSSVSMHDIAEFLDYSFLHILEYRKKIDELEKKNLIHMKEQRNVSHHAENNGYELSGTVMNNVIDNEPIIFVEDEEKTTESVLHEFTFIQSSYLEQVMNYNEYTRQLATAERKNAEEAIVKTITHLFPDDIDTRSIVYYLSLCTILDTNLFEEDGRESGKYPVFLRLISRQKKYARRSALLDDSDILIKENLIERFYEETDEYRRRKTVVKINFKLSENGIKKIFGNEAKLYIKKDLEKTETDKTIDALRDFRYEYENDSDGKFTKLFNLRRIETKYKELNFFKTLQNIITNDEYRFIVYDVTMDYISGEQSNLPATLNDIYGHSPVYFSELRSFLDDKHELIEKGFFDVEKCENIERTSMTITDKILELLYGENADIYTHSVTGRNIIENEKIKAKELFYSDTVQKQIDMLRESLEQKKLEAMQERLAKKGLPKGVAVLLYGAPGTGKTETVYQLAKQTNHKIFHVDIAESKSMWFGESEKKIKKIFTDYRILCKNCKNHNENTPILLFNEADALISKRRDVDSGNCAQTENAIQNILLEEMEKLDGIMIATTNLCENMDKAFERRFLFKVKYEKPSLEARENIWRTKMNNLGAEDITKLAKEFDFSGGEIDNIVRKCEMNEIIKGTQPDYEEIVELCKTERLENAEEHRMGFCG